MPGIQADHTPRHGLSVPERRGQRGDGRGGGGGERLAPEERWPLASAQPRWCDRGAGGRGCCLLAPTEAVLAVVVVASFEVGDVEDGGVARLVGYTSSRTFFFFTLKLLYFPYLPTTLWANIMLTTVIHTDHWNKYKILRYIMFFFHDPDMLFQFLNFYLLLILVTKILSLNVKNPGKSCFAVRKKWVNRNHKKDDRQQTGWKQSDVNLTAGNFLFIFFNRGGHFRYFFIFQ